MSEPRPPYSVEFYADEDGYAPALAFMRSLTPAKRRAIGVAITSSSGTSDPTS